MSNKKKNNSSRLGSLVRQKLSDYGDSNNHSAIEQAPKEIKEYELSRATLAAKCAGIAELSINNRIGQLMRGRSIAEQYSPTSLEKELKKIQEQTTSFLRPIGESDEFKRPADSLTLKNAILGNNETMRSLAEQYAISCSANAIARKIQEEATSFLRPIDESDEFKRLTNPSFSTIDQLLSEQTKAYLDNYGKGIRGFFEYVPDPDKPVIEEYNRPAREQNILEIENKELREENFRLKKTADYWRGKYHTDKAAVSERARNSRSIFNAEQREKIKKEAERILDCLPAGKHIKQRELVKEIAENLGFKFQQVDRLIADLIRPIWQKSPNGGGMTGKNQPASRNNKKMKLGVCYPRPSEGLASSALNDVLKKSWSYHRSEEN